MAVWAQIVADPDHQQVVVVEGGHDSRGMTGLSLVSDGLEINHRQRCGIREQVHMRYIRAQHRGRVLWITFDRPEKLNILHPQDLSELRDVIAGLASGVQAIVFTGTGQAAFSAGVPSVIDATLLPAFVGLSKAREMVLTGDIYKP